MADEKALLKGATDALSSIEGIKVASQGVVSSSEEGFTKKQPWPAIKQNVRLLGVFVDDQTKKVTAAEKALKAIKGKKGALEKPGKDLDAAITTAQAALKSASGVFKIHEKMVVAIEKSDSEILVKLKDAVAMGETTLGEIGTRTITLPGEISVIEDSFFANGVPASAIKQPLGLLLESTKKLGTELTTGRSVAESLAELAKQEPSVFESKAVSLIADAKKLTPKLVTALGKGKTVHADGLKAVAGYAARLALMPKA